MLNTAFIERYEWSVKAIIDSEPCYVEAHKDGICGFALRAASNRGDEDTVRLPLAKGVNANVLVESIEPVEASLEAACRSGHLGVARVLLERGAHVDGASTERPLCLASQGAQKR